MIIYKFNTSLYPLLPFNPYPPGSLTINQEIIIHPVRPTIGKGLLLIVQTNIKDENGGTRFHRE